MRNTRTAVRPSASWVATLLGTGLLGCSPSDTTAAYPGWSEGTAGYATPLSVPLGNRRAKLCQATVLGPHWAITAAHCFTEAPPDGRARLEKLGLGFSIAQVRIHPLAHSSGATRIESAWNNDDIQAAHDLALIFLDDETADAPGPRPTHAWDPQCMASVGAGTVVEFAAGDAQSPQTGHALTLGSTSADVLLGDGQDGVMLAVYGVQPVRGDSGSGLVAHRSALSSELVACLPTSPRFDQPVLLGVVQNASRSDDDLPFGAVPLYTPEHASWLRSFLSDPSQSP